VTAYVEGRDGRLWTSHRGLTAQAGWSRWTPLPDSPGGRAFYSEPGADPFSAAVFVRGNDGIAWMLGENHRWVALGGRFTSGLTGLSQTVGQGTSTITRVYGRGLNGLLYYRSLSSPTWRPVGS
jgi:hypothetical protein